MSSQWQYPKTDSQRIEKASLLHGPSGHISAQTLAHPKGAVSLLPPAAVSEGGVGAPLGPGPNEGLAGTNLIGSCAQDFNEHCLIRAQTLHGLLQLPGIVLTGAVQQRQGCLLEMPAQLTLQHILQVLSEDIGSPGFEWPGRREAGVCSPTTWPRVRKKPTMGTPGVIETGALWTQ